MKSFLQTVFGTKKSDPGFDPHIELVEIPAGKFLMGSPATELGRLKDETQHEVILTKGFKMGKFPITQAQWLGIMGEKHFYFSEAGEDVPADSISWEDCQAFLRKLTKATGKTWRLPTEAEWEYACRAGTQTALNNGNDLTNDYECPYMNEVGWYGRNAQRALHPVGQKRPNAWGLYDMHGNLYEWCFDGYRPYPMGPVTDPRIAEPGIGGIRVVRGGCWLVSARSCRSANRGYGHPADRHEMYGLRVVCE